MKRIIYSSKKVEKYFLDLNSLKKKCGVPLTKQIVKRIMQLESFGNVYELVNAPIDHPHFLEGDLLGCIGWSLNSNVRLILDTGKGDKPKNIQEMKDIEEIIIKGVVDYHGKKNEWIIN